MLWTFLMTLFNISVSLPSDTGHAPSLQKYKRTAFIQKCNFGEAARRKAFLLTVETRRAACRQQRSPRKREIQSLTKWDQTIFDSFWCLSLPTRGTPRLYRNTDAPRLYKNAILGRQHPAKPFC